MLSEDNLKTSFLTFKNRHKTTYRYSKLREKTPVKALASTQVKLRFPDPEDSLSEWRKKPTEGKYHLVSLILRDLKLDVFGEKFPVPPDWSTWHLYPFACAFWQTLSQEYDPLLSSGFLLCCCALSELSR